MAIVKIEQMFFCFFFWLEQGELKMNLQLVGSTAATTAQLMNSWRLD